MQEFEFYAARTLDDLCRILAETGGRVIAGGTDVLVQMQRGVFPADCLVDASRVAELRFIRQENGWIHIGALATYADILASPLLRRAAPSLLEAAALVGAPQTRSRGTLGGNIANASPAGDTLPPLLALNAHVRLVCQGGERRVPLADVLRGPGKTCLGRGEIIHSIAFPRLPEPAGMAFLKLGNRHGMCISVVSAAAVLAVDGRITEVRIALGAVAPTAVRSPHAEALLVGQVPGPEIFQKAAHAALEDIAPISDVRGTAAYRRQAAERLVQRTLERAAQRMGSGVLV